MRIHRVSMAGFGPFRGEVTLDVESFAPHGLFLINGPTGAGKSTLLDAIVFALYGSTPRYASQAGAQVRSQFCTPQEPTWVELDFTCDETTYRVRRSPEYLRPRARGEGMTRERASAELSRWDGAQWIGLESQLRTVGQRLFEILPLSAEQFLQVVMLAQGKFEEFLVASSAERQPLLRTLFDTARFADYDHELQQRAAAMRAGIQRADDAVSGTVSTLCAHVGEAQPAHADEEWVATVLRAQDDAAEATRLRRDADLEEVTRLRQGLEAAQSTAERQVRVARLRREQERLTDRADEMASLAARLRAARSAEALHALHDTVARTAARVQESSEVLDKAESRHAEVCGAEVADLSAQRDAWVALRGQLQRGLEAERALVGVLARLREVDRQVAAHTEQRHQCDAAAARHREVLADVAGTPVAQAESRLKDLRFEHALARRHAEARQEAAQCEVAALRAGERRTAASAALVDLRRALLDGYAGTLAASLHDDEPCPVCGSPEHPAPAPKDPGAVGVEEIDAAEERLREAHEHASDAEQVAAAARALVQETKGARSDELLAGAVADATLALAVARDEERRRQLAADELARLEAAQHAADVALSALGAEREAVTTDADRLRAEIERARGECDTVEARSSDLALRIEAVSALLAARTDHRSCLEAHQEATTSFGAGLARHGFADSESYVRARMSVAEADAIDAEVRAHAEAVAATTTALSDPSLQGLPEALVDVEEPRAHHARAEAALQSAIQAHGVAQERLRTAQTLAAQVRSGWGRSASEREAYESVDRLARTLHGESPNTRRLRLESYVLASELAEVTEAANGHLASMSAGRYALQVSDDPATRGNNSGLEVKVCDGHTGTARAPESLSGGERFLASLALALGLAQVVTERAGGITLDTLFVDEGFGSLDGETLDLVMQVLDGLRAHGRTVGVISHVATMQERIPAQVVVAPQAGGWSEVSVLT